LVHREETPEVQVAPIHHIKTASFYRQNIQHINFIQLATTDVKESRNSAAQIQ